MAAPRDGPMGDPRIYANLYRRGSGSDCKSLGIQSSGGSTPSVGTKKVEKKFAKMVNKLNFAVH